MPSLDAPFTNRMQWGAALLAGATLLLGLWFAREVLLLGFAGVLFALVLRTPAEWIAARTPIPTRVAVGLVAVGIALALWLAFWLQGDAMARQVQELRREIPAAVDRLQDALEERSWGRTLLERAPSADEVVADTPDVAARAGGVVASTVGALASALIILFLGIVLALTPGVYVRNGLLLLPRDKRVRGAEVLARLGSTLRWWLLGRLISMTVVGLATGIGLALMGVPLAFVLGLLAALLTFVPNIGPVLSAVPAILLVLPGGIGPALQVAALYAGVQFVESYVLDPVIDRKTVYLPPALTVMAQLIMALVAGILGVALATPLAAAGVVLVRMLWVEDVLGEKTVGSRE